jgi:hypothetical protein
MDINIHNSLPTTKRSNKNNHNIRPIYKHWLEDSRKNTKKQAQGFINLNLTKHVIPIHLVQYENFLVKLQNYVDNLFESRRSQFANEATLYYKCIDNVSKHLNCYKPKDILTLSSYMTTKDFDHLHFLSCMHNTLTHDNLHAFVRTDIDTAYFSNEITPERISEFSDQLSRVFAKTDETACDSWEEVEEIEIFDGRLLIHSVMYLQDEFTTSSFPCITSNFKNLERLLLMQTNLTVNDIKMEEEDALHMTKELFRCLLEHCPHLMELSINFCQWLRWQVIRDYIPQIQALQASHRIQWKNIEIHNCLCYLQVEDPKYLVIESSWRDFIEDFSNATNIRISMYS